MKLTLLWNYISRVWFRKIKITEMVFVLNLTEPIFYFGDVEYSVDESAGYVEVQVWRTGTDLSRSSSVTLRSQKTHPPSANGEQFSIITMFYNFQLTMTQRL